MNLKNYTSTVPASKSIAAIEKLLAEAGARNVSKEYGEDSSVRAFMFMIIVNNQPMTFKLPCNVLKVKSQMMHNIRRPRKETTKRVAEQAERTAWRLLHEWVAIQISMLELEQVEVMEIFLPYVYDQRTNMTLFEHAKSGEFKQLMPAKDDNEISLHN